MSIAKRLKPGNTVSQTTIFETTSTNTNGGYGVSIVISPKLNPLEVLVVTEHYKNRGIKNYTLTEGNDCIHAYYGFINEYFIFREGKLVDVQID